MTDRVESKPPKADPRGSDGDEAVLGPGDGTGRGPGDGRARGSAGGSSSGAAHGAASGVASGLESTEIARDAVFLLEKLGAVGTLDANRELKDFGLNARSFSVLSLAGEESAPTQKALAEMLTLDPSQIVALVDRLQGEGLVERVPDERDRRIRRVNATREGDEVCRKARERIFRAQRVTLSELDESEVRQLVALLGKALFGRAGSVG